MNSLSRLFTNERGFSLVETMIAAALAAGVALTVAKIGQESSRVSKSMETNLEINQAMNDIAYILSDKESCNATVNVGTTPPVNSNVADIKSVKNGVTSTKYIRNQKYGNGAFSIVDIDTVDAGSGNVDLEIVFRRENKVAYGSQEIKKKIPLKAVVDSGNITSCFSDTENMIEEAAKKACNGNSAHWNDTTKECEHNITNANTCLPGQKVRNIQLSDGEMTQQCVDVIENPQTCSIGSVVTRIDSTGKATCSPTIPATACPNGQYAAADGTGKVVCKGTPTGCTANQVLVSTGGNFRCVTAMCATNQYLVGIDPSTGSQVCRNVQSKDCTAGQYVTRVNADGSYDCGNLPPTAMGVAAANQYIRGYAANGNVYANTIPTCTTANSFLQFDGTNFTCVAMAAGAALPPTCTGDNYLQFDGTNYQCVPGKWTSFASGIEYASGDFRMRINNSGSTTWDYKGTTSARIVVNGTSLGAHGPGGILTLNRSADNTTGQVRSVSLSHGRLYLVGDISLSSPSGIPSEIDFGYNHKIHALNGLQFDDATSFSISKGATCSSSDYAKIRFAVRQGAGDKRIWGCIYWNGKWQWREMSWFD